MTSCKLIYNCEQCGDEMEADEAIESSQKRGFVTCKCCDTPSKEDKEEHFAYLVESQQIVIA